MALSQIGLGRLVCSLASLGPRAVIRSKDEVGTEQTSHPLVTLWATERISVSRRVPAGRCCRTLMRSRRSAESPTIRSAREIRWSSVIRVHTTHVIAGSALRRSRAGSPHAPTESRAMKRDAPSAGLVFMLHLHRSVRFGFADGLISPPPTRLCLLVHMPQNGRRRSTMENVAASPIAPSAPKAATSVRSHAA
jgi:hypothetical protein